ncbi:MAG: phosphoribosylanthranilate isomerase [Pseudomonadales bacterium]
MSTKVKICGVTRLEDAEAVVRAGADSLGLNFSPGSQRKVNVETAAEISVHVRGALQRVGLFVNASVADVEAILRQVELDVLQFHGEETGSYCEAFGVPFMKAIRMRGALDLAALQDEYHAACCLLLDAYVPGEAGGTGTRFDLQFWPERASKRLVLAGGLTPDNVAEAIRTVRPYAVDVCGGVEGAAKGEKDRGRIMQFVKEVKSV